MVKIIQKPDGNFSAVVEKWKREKELAAKRRAAKELKKAIKSGKLYVMADVWP